MPEMSTSANNVNWLVANSVERVPGVSEAVDVSSDGLPTVMSAGLGRDAAYLFAAFGLWPDRTRAWRSWAIRWWSGQ